MRFAAALFALSAFTGCESTDNGSSSNTTVYYGAAFYDPWYHGDYDHDHDYDVVVTPPPANRPPPGGGGNFAPHPEHPIARPPPGDFERPGRPSTQPTRPPSVSTRPSIPSAPRPAPRGGGGRR
ncbi:MAG TPA: hypothetical protein VK850_13625 [Candidatus Binatia bacterium]|nr:hypothetical protein [Candidatus Binatia bacterium]